MPHGDGPRWARGGHPVGARWAPGRFDSPLLEAHTQLETPRQPASSSASRWANGRWQRAWWSLP